MARVNGLGLSVGSAQGLEAMLQHLPTLMRLRRIVTFLHWMGRWGAGLSPREDALEQLDDALGLDTGLPANSGQLLDRVAAAA